MYFFPLGVLEQEYFAFENGIVQAASAVPAHVRPLQLGDLSSLEPS